MAFPLQDKTISKANLLNRAMAHAQAMHGSLISKVRGMENGNVSGAGFNGLMADLYNLQVNLAPVAQREGIDDFALAELGRPVSADAAAILAKITEVRKE